MKQTTHKKQVTTPITSITVYHLKGFSESPLDFISCNETLPKLSWDPRNILPKHYSLLENASLFYSSVRTYQCTSKCTLSIKILSWLFWTEPQGLSPFWVRSVWYHIFIYGIIHFGPKTGLVPVNGTRLIKAFEEINYSF